MNRDDAARRLSRLDAVLYALALLLACGCVIGGVLLWRDHQAGTPVASDPAALPDVAEQDRYGEVKAAAEATAVALVNIDHRDPEASFEAVAATATGTFLEQYRASSQSLVELVTLYRSRMTGRVVSSAVSDVDADSATVLVATTGTVTNAQTGADRQQRNFRLLVSLVRSDDGDGAWLTDDLEFVG